MHTANAWSADTVTAAASRAFKRQWKKAGRPTSLRRWARNLAPLVVEARQWLAMKRLTRMGWRYTGSGWYRRGNAMQQPMTGAKGTIQVGTFIMDKAHSIKITGVVTI